MPLYDYKAKDRNGHTVTGTVDAPDEHAAAGMIRELGHLPMDIREARGRRTGPAHHTGSGFQIPTQNGPIPPQHGEAGNAFARYLIYPIWTGVNLKMLALFYRQLATMLAAGMSLSEALRSLSSRTRGRFGVIIAEMRDDVSQGRPMSGAMMRYPKVFSRLQIALVRAGESGGLLERMIDRIAAYLEYELKIRALIAKALIYPVIILIFAWLAYICVPVMSVLVKDGFVPFIVIVWPPILRGLIWVIGIIVVLKLIFQFYTPRLIWDSVKVHIPIVGGNARKIALSRFSNALAVLYAAGMSMVDSVDIAADACANLYMGRAIKYAIPALQSGRGLTESLTRTRVLSPMVLDMLAVGERSGDMDATLQKAAEYMDSEVDASIHKIGIALFVLMILIAGFIVGSIVIDFWRKLYDAIMGAAGQ